MDKTCAILGENGVVFGSDTVQKFIDFVASYNLDESALDEAVIDAKSGEASDINNGGQEEQAKYILSWFSNVEDARKEIERIVAEG